MTGIPDVVEIRPGRLQGSVSAPPSKSVMQRVLALLLLRNSDLTLPATRRSDDDETLLGVLRAAGFVIEETPTRLRILAPATQTLRSVDFRDSGLAARMLLPVLALGTGRISLNASPQLRKRGFGPLLETLIEAGLQADRDSDGWPRSIQGPVRMESLRIDGSFSSQPVTGLLYAMAAGDGDTSLTVSNPVSTPYIDLSLQVMEALGAPVPARLGYERFDFAAGRAMKKMPQTFDIEGDWSAAAFWLVAGAIAGPLRITGLDAFSSQGDKSVLQALMDSGAGLSIESAQITVRPAALQAFHFNATDSPDLFPPLAVLGCFASGQSVIEGVARLRSKESDRAATIIMELGKLGADIRLQDDLMIITGAPLHGGTVDTHGDHRIAMMAAIAALGASAPVRITGAAAVAKSYPAFFDDLSGLGADINPS